MTNRQMRVLYGGCDNCYEPMYIKVSNTGKKDTVWMCFDVEYYCSTLCPEDMSYDKFAKQLSDSIEDCYVSVISDSLFEEYYKYNRIIVDEEIYNYYKQYGVDSLMQHYDLNKYGNIFLEGNTDGKKIDYIGFLLWQNDILIGMGDEVNEWYYVR
ncbi:MAG: hypothetical protein MJ007_02410 [Paludibacteraceae bacterium]|nr:hypothetical protein [Paludibacteraceae bacterium]